jgi:hypothetical protein
LHEREPAHPPGEANHRVDGKLTLQADAKLQALFKEVYWGDQSWEEMFAGFVDLVIPAEMNPVDLARPRKPVSPQAAS